MLIEKEIFDQISHKKVELYTLTNKKRMQVKIANYGCIVVSILVPDRWGNMGDVVLGFDQLDDYISDGFYMGAIVGRCANRIANGQFTIDDKEYRLVNNMGENHLHGGLVGFNKVVWDAQVIEHGEGSIHLEYISRDGEEGYPGTLKSSVTYLLGEDNSLSIATHSVTNKPTVVNLVNHTYFNLAGKGDILGHELMINADRFTPTDEASIPTGKIRSVKGLPFDFRKSTAIGERIDHGDEQLQFGSGYDHNWVLNKEDIKKLTLAAQVKEPNCGRLFEVYTNQPGIQFYSGNFLKPSVGRKQQRQFGKRSGFCLETQHFPDSPNHPHFPSVILRPGEEYTQETIFKFSTE